MKIAKYAAATIAILTLSFSTYSQHNDDAVVMTVDGDEITKQEFLQVYLKNNDDPNYDKESLDEYMELYKKFKLKVAEAEDLGYDTIPSLVRELNGYKKQLARPYLVDSSKSNALIKEAYKRMKHEVRASHILIKLPPNAAPADTLKAYKKAMALRKRVVNGEDFEDVASGKGGSEDPSAAKNKGDLGYFTSFQMVYPFETAAYNTEIGEVSMAVRTKFGYHLVYVKDKREARGTITAAHIMVMIQKDATKSDIQNAKKKADELYEQLEDGASFEKLARLHSDDQGSKSKGGRLPAFGSGTNQRMVGEFEDAAFALKEDGDYSKPFRTDYGYHIVKRIEYEPLGDFKDLRNSIKQKVNKGARAQQSQHSFIKKLKEENKFKDKGDKRMTWFYENIDSTIFTTNWKSPSVDKNKWMFKYNGTEYDMQSFMDYLKTTKKKRPMPIETFLNNQYSTWQGEKIMDDEKGRLEEKYPKYRSLLQEYHDGVILYEVMKDKVWNKASKDSVGLEKHYEASSDKHQWPERLKATIYSSDKKDKVMEAKMLCEMDTVGIQDIIKKVNTDSQLNLQVDNGKFIQSDHPILSKREVEEGLNPIFKDGEKYYLVQVKEVIPAGPKSLNEVRGTTIQSYQNKLEKEWLKELNEKHTITVNKEVLYSLGQ